MSKKITSDLGTAEIQAEKKKTDLIEEALKVLAVPLRPAGTEARAIAHQWMHALAFGTPLFAQGKVTREQLTAHLVREGLYTTQELFRAEIEDSIFLKPEETPQTEFTFIDLFAGIGGMRQGFEMCGGRCVFSSEFERNAQFTYCENYGEYPFGDITAVDPADIPVHDILVGGFPCQPFSHAGRKLGIEDTRGTLFHNIALIIQSKRPRAVLLENVRGLISHDKGYTLKVILTTLINEGYHCNIPDEIIRGEDIALLQKEAKKMVMKSRDFGVPQNRQRIFIVLWRNDLPVTFHYPQPLELPVSVGDILEENVPDAYILSDKLWAGHQRRKMTNKKDGKGFGYGLVTADSPYTGTISARYYKDGSEILVAGGEGNPRKLTPLEAARLQGFPDRFLINPSKVQAYRQFGNSVTVPVVKAVAECIRVQIIRQD